MYSQQWNNTGAKLEVTLGSSCVLHLQIVGGCSLSGAQHLSEAAASWAKTCVSNGHFEI